MLATWTLTALPAVGSARQAGGQPPQEPGTSAGRSVLDGVFTLDQASRGQQKFKQACTACHMVGEHTGRRFAGKWGGMSVGELLDLVSATMPEGDPGSLQPAEYVSILAYFLRESGYPEGAEELPAESSELMKVRIVPRPE
jgi:mono/diheme cytochrome c family protein